MNLSCEMICKPLSLFTLDSRNVMRERTEHLPSEPLVAKRGNEDPDRQSGKGSEVVEVNDQDARTPVLDLTRLHAALFHRCAVSRTSPDGNLPAS